MKRFTMNNVRWTMFLLLMGGAMFNAQCSMVFAQNDAMFIYRNDGVINAFLKADIDSIRHSALDLDSMIHAENVTQEVWTVDSVYRIPLAAIDSVSFITPPTKYKEGVTRLDYNLLEYITGAEGRTLKLKPNTPTTIVPVKGDKLVLLEGCDVLPYGFSGIVSRVETGVSSIDVVCEQAYLEDIFDSFCNVSTAYGGNPDDDPESVRVISGSGRQRVIYSPDDVVFSLGPYRVNRSYEVSQGVAFDGDLALSGDASFSVEIQPTCRIHTFLIMGEGQGTYFSYSITGNLRITSQSSLYGGISYNHDFDGLIAQCPIPMTGNMVNFYINPGLFVRADATITSTITSTQNYTFGSTFDYSSKGLNTIKPSVGGRLASSSVDMNGSLDGSLAGGAYLEVGFNLLSRDIAKACVRGEIGARFSGSFVLRNSDIENATKGTELYERLKASGVELSSFANISLQASVAHTGNGLTWELSEPIHTWNLVPEFSNTRLMPLSQRLIAYTELSGECLFPVKVGYKLFDGDKNEVANYDASVNYTNKSMNLRYIFSGLEDGVKYKVYPKVKFLGYDILAAPAVELKIPEIKEFCVTGFHYSKGAYHNDGIAYDYKFNVATTVEIKDIEGIRDWGYVYRDPKGNIKHISLMQYGTSYTDTCYAYYRNEAQSTVCLYGYVRYEGSNYYVYGKPENYEIKPPLCPDDHHPHAIDLGLPSDTKWCCCNVGASTPEDHGGHYAWGETSEKSVYNWDTYAYWHDSNGDGFLNYGEIDISISNIAGTNYDVARVRMGTPWRMPSAEQIRELIDKCTHQWIQLNGVEGILETGPNGLQIFLPATGCHWGNNLNGVGSYGHYWSSILEWSNWNNSYYADIMEIDSNGYRFTSSSPCGGHSVRAVCP